MYVKTASYFKFSIVRTQCCKLCVNMLQRRKTTTTNKTKQNITKITRHDIVPSDLNKLSSPRHQSVIITFIVNNFASYYSVRKEPFLYYKIRHILSLMIIKSWKQTNEHTYKKADKQTQIKTGTNNVVDF